MVLVINVMPRPLYQWETDLVLILYEAGWAPGPVRTGEENQAPHWDLIPGTGQTALTHNKDRAIPVHVHKE